MNTSKRLNLTFLLLATFTSTNAYSGVILVDETCNVVEAITSAENDNASGSACEAGSDADTIVLPNNSLQILTRRSSTDIDTGLPTISSRITIQGNNSTITRRASSSQLFRFFKVVEGGSLNLNQLTLENADVFGRGGAISAENAEVELNNVKIINNRGGLGAGISAQDSNVRIYNSEIVGNISSSRGGGISIMRGTVEIRNSLISENSANSAGGGLYLSDLIKGVIIDSSVSKNSTKGFSGGRGGGGGAHITGSVAFVPEIVNILVRNTTFNNNQADEDGGGLYVAGKVNLQLINSTLSGNTGLDGGGIEAHDADNILLVNTTIAKNSGTFGGGISSSRGSRLSLSNSLISGNTASEQGAEVYQGLGGEVNLVGRNLLGNISLTTEQALWNLGVNRDVINANSDGNRPTPLTSILQPLADNGGNTLTHSLADNSPAIDSGDIAVCSGNKDQRGFDHVGVCDLGSFEFGSPGPQGLNPVALPAIFILIDDEY